MTFGQKSSRIFLSLSAAAPVLLAGAVSVLLVGCETEPEECPANYDDIGGLCVQEPIPQLLAFDGDLTIETPQDAVDFCNEYNAVFGNLTLGPQLSSAEGLVCLQQVAGDLILEELDGIVHIRGFLINHEIPIVMRHRVA